MATICQNLSALTKNTKQNKKTLSYTCSNKKCYNHPRPPLHTYFTWHSEIWAAETKKLSWLFSSKGKPKVFLHWKLSVTRFNSSCHVHLQPLTRGINSWFYWGLRDDGIINYRAVKWMEAARATYLLCKLVQHARADGCRVRTEDVLLGLFDLPVIFVPGSNEDIPTFGRLRNMWALRPVFIPLWAVSSLWMNLLHSL